MADPESTASAGQVASDDAAARVPGANTQLPVTPPQILTPEGRVQTAPTTSSTNADPAVAAFDVDFGTDAPTRTISQTQATSGYATAQQAQEFWTGESTPAGEVAAGATGKAIPGGGSPGAGAGNDDAGTKNATVREIDTIFNVAPIVPQANVLDQYASYTYVASVYLMKPEGYIKMITTKKKSLEGASLLFQSGGAPVRGRNPYFTLDYYIDRFSLKSVIAGKGTRSAHNVYDIKMTVVENNGITLVNNLAAAVKGFIGPNRASYGAANYLLVVRFYGYDDQGNLVRGGRAPTVSPVIAASVGVSDAATDPEAFVEKFYPFQINDLKFRIANKLVEYEISATASNPIIGFSADRGTIPYNLALQGKTLKEALSGPIDITPAPPETTSRSSSTTIAVGQDEFAANAGAPPPKADAARSKQTVKSGLMAALTQYQQELVAKGTFTYADTYEIEFINPAIENALIRRAGTPDKTRTALVSAGALQGQLQLNEQQSVNYDQQLIDMVAGRPIVAVLDELVRNSSYMEEQQLAKKDATTGQVIANNPGKNVAWFKIGTQATPIKWDPKRNDFAYNVKYTLSVYKINDANSDWFPKGKYNGVHKQYNYWFTGQNTAILNYEQSINNLYRRVLSGSPFDGTQGTNNINQLTRYVYKTNSAENNQGANSNVNEPAANLADYLYSPEDQQNATLTVVGDPAWLQQGEAFVGQTKKNWSFSAFLADGTINFDSQEVLFEVLFDLPADYDLTTGLIDPTKSNLGGVASNDAAAAVPAVTSNGVASTQGRKAKQSYIYKCTDVTSDFAKGKFTQTLKGVAVTFYPKDIGASTGNRTDSQVAATGAASANRVGNQAAVLPSAAMRPYAPSDANPGDSDQALANQTLAQNLLGSTPTRPQPEAGAPTSNGDLVFEPNNNNIDPNDLAAGNPPPQQIAPPDDYIG
jgi:hypothetical protein